MPLPKDYFLELVKAGLWEQKVRLLPNGEIDYSEVLRLAQEQSVVGLVAAGIEHADVVPYETKLKFIGLASQIQQRNETMNRFIAELVQKMQSAGITTLLVKGQGVAQCYERPLWRTSGDVDLLLDAENYEKAKAFLLQMADHVGYEDKLAKHQGLHIQGEAIELHGRMPFKMSSKVDNEIDEVIKETFANGDYREWNNNGVEISLPNPNNDVIIVFTHFLHHFFIEGVGLKQICDWCRLLWTYRSELDIRLLEQRIKRMGLMSEWRAFAALAVNALGMPEHAMPIYDESYRKKGEMALAHVLKTGNLGHNKDVSYRAKFAPAVTNIITLFRRFRDFSKLTCIFPIDAPKFFVTYVFGKFKV